MQKTYHKSFYYLIRNISTFFITFLICIFSSMTLCAKDIEVNGLKYSIFEDKKQATLIGYNPSIIDKNAIIPETIIIDDDKYAVTIIGKDAFRSCYTIDFVIIGDSVNTIGEDAFRNCVKLVNVTIGKSVKTIEEDAFYGCTSLSTIEIPSSVISIGNYAFHRCGLIYATIGTSVKTIGDYSFSENTCLKSIVIPNSVKEIGESAFLFCSNLGDVTIGDSVEIIGQDAFDFCTELNSVYIKDIAKWCGISFRTNKSNPLYYANNLYLNYELVKDLTIPDTIEVINDYAFINCSCLLSVSIPNSMKKIGGLAFGSCTNLKCLNLGHSVTTIGSYAFSNCTKLEEVIIPNSVTSIEMGAFSGCSNVYSITIGETMPNIYYYAFSKCKNLKDVFCFSKEVPFTYFDPFESTPIENATLHVPAESLDFYSSMFPWNCFGTIKAIEGTNITETITRGFNIETNNGYISITGLLGNEQVYVYNISGVQIGKANIVDGKAIIKASAATMYIVKIGKNVIRLRTK